MQLEDNSKNILHDLESHLSEVTEEKKVSRMSNQLQEGYM